MTVTYTNILDSRAFNVRGGGSIDDFSALQDALNAAANCALVIQPGLYSISDMLKVPSNCVIFADGVTIKAASSMSKSAIPLLLSDSSWTTGIQDVTIRGLTIDGNRANRSSGSNGGGNFYISASRRIKLIDCISLNSTQEGFQAAGNTTWTGGLSTKIDFINCRSDNAYRNGLSMTGTKCARIFGGDYDNTNGADPAVGIEIEPNNANTPNLDFIIANASCTGNGKFGIALYNSNYVNTGHIHHVNVSDNGIYGMLNTATCTQVVVDGVRGSGNVTGLIAPSAYISGLNDIDLADYLARPYHP